MVYEFAGLPELAVCFMCFLFGHQFMGSQFYNKGAEQGAVESQCTEFYETWCATRVETN